MYPSAFKAPFPTDMTWRGETMAVPLTRKPLRLYRLVLLGVCMVVSIGAANPARPFLLFSPEELPAIRKTVRDGTPKIAFGILRRQADQALTADDIAPFRVDPLVALAFVWRVTEDERYAERLQMAVEEMVAQNHLDDQHPTNPRVRTPRFEWPLVYDIGFEALSDEARAGLRAYLAERAEDGYRHLYDRPGAPGMMVSNLMLPAIVAPARFGLALKGQGPLPGIARLKWVMLTADEKIDLEVPELINTPQTVSVPITPPEGTEHPGWHQVVNDAPAPKLAVEFLEVNLTQDVFDAMSHARFRHPRLRAKNRSVNPRFLAMLYPFAEGDAMPVISYHPTRYGFRHQLAWPGAVDYIGTREEQLGGQGSNGNFFIVRTPLEEGENPADQRRVQNFQPPPELTYLMVNGTFLTFGGAPLIQLWDQLTLGHFNDEERDRTVRHRPFHATVACSGDTLDVKAMTSPDARLQFLWAFRLRAFAPRAQTVTVNGVETSFRRDGDYLEVDGDTEVFVLTVQRFATQVSEWYRHLLERHPPPPNTAGGEAADGRK